MCKVLIEAEGCGQAHEVRGVHSCLLARLAQWQTRGCLLGLSVEVFINILSCVAVVPHEDKHSQGGGVTTSQRSGPQSRSPHGGEVWVHPSGHTSAPGRERQESQQALSREGKENTVGSDLGHTKSSGSQSGTCRLQST